MKFFIYTQDLIDALRPVVKSAAVKLMKPILAGVKITADGSKV